jgi:uncharacterized membrane protein
VTISNHLTLEPLLAPVLVGVIVAVMAAAAVLISLRRPAPRRGAALLALRLAVVAAVGMLLLRPIVWWTGQEEVPIAVSVLLDASASMDIRDVPPLEPGQPAMSRAESVRSAFLSSAREFEALSKRCIVNPVAFGSSVRPIGSFAPDPVDPRTDIAQALASALAESEGSADPQAPRLLPFEYRLAAVVLVSDGRANRARGSAEETARALAARGVNVHTVLVGSDTPTPYYQGTIVSDVRGPSRIFAGNRAEVRATVKTAGLKGTTLTLELVGALEPVGMRGAAELGRVLETAKVAVTADQTRQEVVFRPRLDEPGLLKLVLMAKEIVADTSPSQELSEAATYIRVDEGAIRILYLDGRIQPEGKYIARVLGEAPEIEFDRRLLIGGATGPAPDDLGNYDLVILGDVPASALDSATVARLAERVRAGKLALLTLGGQAAYGAGGWAGTPLAGVLPVEIKAGDGQVPGPLAMRPAPAAATHFIFAGDTAMPLSFAGLPPLSGASAVGPLAAGAQLMAESADGKPLLAVREFGAGRAAAFMADTTWQWAMAPTETRGSDIHRRFWRQLVLWLAGRDARPRMDSWVTTDRPMYVLSDPDNPPVAEVTAHLPPEVTAVGPAEVVLRLDDGHDPSRGHDQSLQLASVGGGDWRALLPLCHAGVGTIIAGAGKGTIVARTEFGVIEQNFEYADVLADGAAMERLAEAGGGTFKRVADLPALLADLTKTLQPQYEPKERSLPLAEGRVFLALVLALLAGEWLLRRRWVV